uniref:Nuclear export mediator factor NEMF n=1 Tax=Hirondellea gigas TaxID=1518452 RepID=A0A2P2I4N3_9CRUS
MKLTFSSIDVRAVVAELQNTIIGLRVNQIYDVDHKTYLIRLQKPDHKAVLLLESSARMHTTDYQWPKNPAPSGFSMKLRKHLRNKRLECIQQLGVDRVVQMTFGSGVAQHHLIIELYDRGNITLTDADYTILIILRPRKDGEETRFAAREVYPIKSFRSARPPPSLQQISDALKDAKPNINVKKILNPLLDCGAGVVWQELTRAGLAEATVSTVRDDDEKLQALVQVAASARQHIIDELKPQGYIIQKQEQRVGLDKSSETVLLQQEFHPALYTQHQHLPYLHYPTFNQACDEFFQQLESQKLQQRSVHQERDAIKKLDNVRTDHTNRLNALKKLQDQDTQRGQLIELNQVLVDAAISQVRSAVAHQLDWREIEELLLEAQEREDPVSLAIKSLSLATNSITMTLSNPYDREEDDILLDSDEEREEGQESDKLRPTTLDIDLDLSAHANARKFYTSRRKAGTKVQKTMAASEAALKSATRKTKQTLKDVHTSTVISKVRKVHWFEKFLWFISSENYLVLAGHDQQQNEVLVKRHLKSNDVYVHADLHGASSVIVKNNTTTAIPPATLHQAGVMALCYSRAWAEKVVTSAWWVWGNQVSKSAPTGEYLTTGAFMVRGKKNFLPPSHLVYGFGFLFRLEESSISRHEGERKPKTIEEGSEGASDRLALLEIDIKEDELVVESADDEEPTAKDEAEHQTQTQENDKELIVEFPDTIVEMTHVYGDTFAVSTTSFKGVESRTSNKVEVVKTELPIMRKHRGGRGKGSICESTVSSETVEVEQLDVVEAATKELDVASEGSTSGDTGNAQQNKISQLKRGQKSRLKKLKTKYKDQDDEERELRMQILQSAGAKKAPKKLKGKKGKMQARLVQQNNIKNAQQTAGVVDNIKQPVTEQERKPTEKAKQPEGDVKEDHGEQQHKSEESHNIQQEDDDEEEEETSQVNDDLAILKALTGQPDAEDELLYTVPVCAPYNALSNYKYKVKLTPGPSKKGKACKTAVSLFLAMKPPNGRECDLLRAVRDSDLARNVPGKVKISAPNISKVKK